jgi:hypothetical protein
MVVDAGVIAGVVVGFAVSHSIGATRACGARLLNCEMQRGQSLQRHKYQEFESCGLYHGYRRYAWLPSKVSSITVEW